MDKRYQVFVSSTFEDLQEERKEVMQALLELDCIPAGMELFPASNDDQWSLIRRVIDDSDYYILIVGGRYGSTNEKGVSYTQMEFEYALESGKPIISFLHKDPGSIPLGKSEQDEEKKKKLEEFKTIVQKKLVRYWNNPENLGSIVSRSMIKLIKDFPAEGWVRSGSAVDEKSMQEIVRLQRENEELRGALTRVETEPPKGSEVFAQGEDKVSISYTFVGTDISTGGDIEESISHKDVFSWDELFMHIAPFLIVRCSEKQIRDKLDEFVENRGSWRVKKKIKNLENIDYFSITDESFNLIIIQFRALGLICLSENMTPVSKSAYWKLTQYGDYKMTALLAKKRH